MTCGTVEECGNDASNCCAYGGEYGHNWQACITPCQNDSDCTDDTTCIEGKCIDPDSCISEGMQEKSPYLGDEDPNIDRECCDTLSPVMPIEAYDENCEETESDEWAYVCTDCGNGVCEEWESKCNCEEDCLIECDPACGEYEICSQGECVGCVDNGDCFYQQICIENQCSDPECDPENPCEEGECKSGICILPEEECIIAGEEEKSPYLGEDDPNKDIDCCSGLIAVEPIEFYDEECNEAGLSEFAYVCTDCGNDVCEEWESKCNCEEDCLTE